MKARTLTNPLLRLAFWIAKQAFKRLGSAELQNKLGFSLWNWLTPFVERSGYSWELYKKNIVSEHVGKETRTHTSHEHVKGTQGPGAIEADEAEPWYGGDAVENEDSNVVIAEPPIVYASRGNAKMAEREEERRGHM